MNIKELQELVSYDKTIFTGDIPQYVIWVKKPRKEYALYYYNKALEDYSDRFLTGTEAMCCYYLMNHQTLLKELMDERKVYNYIRQRAKYIDSLVEKQTKKWIDDDDDILLAEMNGDEEEKERLINNLHYRAEELIYRDLIYR